MDRIQIPKRVRFEVLKRDKFTCQYCGKSAPEVILHVDHIRPVADGGTNDIFNLITACADCNLGKSDIKLSDDVAIKKQKKQLDAMQERREQLEMMQEWQIELANEAKTEAEIVSTVIENVSGYGLTEYGKKEAAKLVRQFGLDSVCKSVITAFNTYDDWDTAWSKVGGICWCSTHITCYQCQSYRGKTYCGNVRCSCVDYKTIRTVKEAEHCEMFQTRE